MITKPYKFLIAILLLISILFLLYGKQGELIYSAVCNDFVTLHIYKKYSKFYVFIKLGGIAKSRRQRLYVSYFPYVRNVEYVGFHEYYFQQIKLGFMVVDLKVTASAEKNSKECTTFPVSVIYDSKGNKLKYDEPLSIEHL
ncbi:MAG: hypothetical protein LBE13_15635 [Bacteroidales bacterium]|jgi:hypothetical protein|nr:hypothetical protein [Bacteroidales bacterium]